jgi:uncharacterized protein
VKSGARYIAIASGPIGNRKSRKTILIGIIFRGNYIEGMLSGNVAIDGTDSTRQIIKMIADSRFHDQVRIVLLNGIAVAGLNIVKPKLLEKELRVKVVLLNRRRQNANELIKALKEFARIRKKDANERINIVSEYSKIKILKTRDLFLQSSLEDHYLRNFAEKAFEALRIAHIIASGISKGESKGRI